MASLLVFDDGEAGLGPLTDLRASFEVRTGALTNLERIERALGHSADGLWVKEALAGIVRERRLAPVNDWSTTQEDDLLAVNGRCVLPPASLWNLTRGSALVDSKMGDVIGLRGSRKQFEDVMAHGLAGAGVAVHPDEGTAMLRRPWDVIRYRDRAIHTDLALLQSTPWKGGPGVVVIGARGVSVDDTARVSPGVVIDAEHGAVRIEAGAVIRPGAILSGPCWIGPGSTVVERAHIKAGTAIGPVCKVGGEIGGTIFQGWSNKGHEGHLGDSWVGEWVNFGAGTTNSNLLNTYGEVVSRVEPTASNEKTGLTFFGSIVGDHAKFAILTRIMTGASVGTGTMWAATAPVSGATPRFVWSTDAGQKPFRFDKFMETARAIMGRRKIEPSGAYIERLRELHAMGSGS